MEKYLLCGELSTQREDDGTGEVNSGLVEVYKGRKRGTVEFCGIWKHSKTVKDQVANGVSV